MRAIDLFSGLGGLALGLHRAGFAVESVERDADACATHGRLLPSSPITCGDATTYSPQGGPVALVAGGAPCQPFSRTGHRRGYDDERGGLALAIPRLAARLGAPAFLLENVADFEVWSRGAMLARFCQEAASLGYSTQARVLDAADFGVPQHRRRLFVVGFAAGGEGHNFFRWPSPWGAQISAHQAIGNGFHAPAPTLTANEHKASRNFGSRGARTAPRHAGDRMGRPLSLADALTLQGLPPALQVAGTKASQYRQVGNAVPPPLAQTIGQAVKDALAKFYRP